MCVFVCERKREREREREREARRENGNCFICRRRDFQVSQAVQVKLLSKKKLVKNNYSKNMFSCKHFRIQNISGLS